MQDNIYESIDYNHQTFYERQERKLQKLEEEMLEQDDIVEEVSRAELNHQTRQAFAQCFTVPEWNNKFVYWEKMPIRTERMTSWPEIYSSFGLTADQGKILQIIEDLTDYRGRLKYKQLKLRNKSRVIQLFIEKEVLKVLKHELQEIIILNPSIVYALNWWSPFMQGFMLAEYMNEYLLHYELGRIRVAEHRSTHAGADTYSNILKLIKK